MPFYSFTCGSCGWRAEQRAGFGVAAVSCPVCSGEAQRESVYLIGFSGFAKTPLDQRTYRQEFKDFKEAGAELEYKHSRMEEAAGKPLATPPLASIAKRQAKELMVKGVTSSEDWAERKRH